MKTEEDDDSYFVAGIQKHSDDTKIELEQDSKELFKGLQPLSDLANLSSLHEGDGLK